MFKPQGYEKWSHHKRTISVVQVQPTADSLQSTAGPTDNRVEYVIAKQLDMSPNLIPYQKQFPLKSTVFSYEIVVLTIFFFLNYMDASLCKALVTLTW